MEDGLVQWVGNVTEAIHACVLILIVVEDGLVPRLQEMQRDLFVLILIVVEDGLVLY